MRKKGVIFPGPFTPPPTTVLYLHVAINTALKLTTQVPRQFQVVFKDQEGVMRELGLNKNAFTAGLDGINADLNLLYSLFCVIFLV